MRAGAEKRGSEMQGGVRRETRVTEGSGTGSAMRADTLWPWSEGRVAKSKSRLNKGAILLSCLEARVGLGCWTGKEGQRLEKKLSCENKGAGLSTGVAAAFLWENQDLSGHERKKF